MLGDAYPRLRPNLRFVRQQKHGKVSYIVKDPIAMKYFRFGEAEVAVLQKLDGKRTLGDVAQALQEEDGMRTTAEAIAPFVRRLKELGLVERTQAERSALLMDSLRRERRLRLKGHGNTLLRMRFSFGDPDALFDRMMPSLGFVWTRTFVLLSIASFAAYFIVMFAYWETFTAGIARFYSPSQITLGFLLATYATAVVIFLIHELGHGITCKRYGGEVHEMGAMLFYFSPAFYCNVNDAWTFESRSHRLWVTFAGGWIQLFIGGLAAVAWIVLEPGTLVSQAAFIAMLMGGGIVLLVNFNPLIPLDGYYALMDWLEIPNLRARAYEYIGIQSKRKLLRLDLPAPPVTPREARIFTIYGVASVLYVLGLLTLVTIFVGGLLVRVMGGWGLALMALAVWRFGGGAFRRLVGLTRTWAAEHRAGTRLRRLLPYAAGGLVVILVALWLVPWTVRVRGSALVEPVAWAELRAPEQARIESFLALEGAQVAAGEPVALLVSPSLDADRLRARAMAASLEHEAAAARARTTGHTAVADVELEAIRALLAQLEARRAALVVRAPFDGRVLTPRLEDRLGDVLDAGAPLLEFAGGEHWRMRILVEQRDAGGIGPGSEVAVRFPAEPRITWRAHVAEVAPATHEGAVVLLAPIRLDGESTVLRPGMTGVAKITERRTTLAGAVGRAIRRNIRLDVLP